MLSSTVLEIVRHHVNDPEIYQAIVKDVMAARDSMKEGNAVLVTVPDRDDPIYAVIVAVEPKRILVESQGCDKRFWLTEKEFVQICWPA